MALTSLVYKHLKTGTGKQLNNFHSIPSYFKTLTNQQKEYFSEVNKLLKLILVMPATNATSERSFSALRRLKTWLRTTLTQERLNWCMILHVHKNRTKYQLLKQHRNLLLRTRVDWTYLVYSTKRITLKSVCLDQSMFFFCMPAVILFSVIDSPALESNYTQRSESYKCTVYTQHTCLIESNLIKCTPDSLHFQITTLFFIVTFLCRMHTQILPYYKQRPDKFGP